MTRLVGQVALVTGAAQGIGQAVARALAGEGAAVAVVDIQAAGAEDTAAELRGRGGQSVAIPCDVGRSDPVNAAVARAEAELGPVAILVNCAGGMLGVRKKPVEQWADDEWQRLLDVNLSACFYFARAVAAGMKARRHGRIVNVSSGAGRSHSRTGLHGYTAAKAGVHGLTRQLAVELGEYGITVNAVAPGLIMSPLGQAAWANRSEAQRQDVLRSIALGRLGEPDEIAGVVAFLCTAAGGYISGQVLGVDGGHWMFG